MNIKAISTLEFNSIIKIRFRNILEGFDNFKYIDLTPTGEQNLTESEELFTKTLIKFFELNNKSVVIDFYKNRLTKESMDIIKESLDDHQMELFYDILNSGSEEDILFIINDKRYIEVLVKLCTRELFFITFYFEKYPLTVWGNYNLKFPMFYISEEEINEYISIAKRNNLLP